MDTRERGGYLIITLALPTTGYAGSVLRKAILEAVEEADMPEDTLHNLLQGISSACNNALKQGSPTQNDPIIASIHVGSRDIIIRLYYPGEPFIFHDPPEDTHPALSTLDFRMMRRTLDEVRYDFRRGRVLVRLTKLY